MEGGLNTYQKMANFIGSHVMQSCHKPIETDEHAFSGFICKEHLHTISDRQLTYIKLKVHNLYRHLVQ